jgi:hypothetical protein
MFFLEPRTLYKLDAKEYFLLSHILMHFNETGSWPDPETCADHTNATLPMMYRVRKSLLNSGVLELIWRINEEGLPVKIYRIKKEYVIFIDMQQLLTENAESNETE